MVTSPNLIQLVVFLNIAQALKSDLSNSSNFDAQTRPWISLGNLEYKIFGKNVRWEEASNNCKEKNATLALLNNKNLANTLSKYLRNGKPWVQTAWIGFGNKNRRRVCPILDSKSKTGFVKNCYRPRKYICQRKNLNRAQIEYYQGRKGVVDFIFNTGHRSLQQFSGGYRLFNRPVPWDVAKKHCETFKKYYGGKLMEPRTEEKLIHLRQIMSQSQLPVRHLWLGGNYVKNTWKWISDKSKIDVKKFKTWLKNDTFEETVEFRNNCLNVDKENFQYLMFYGADCNYPQAFLCSFSIENLRQLQTDELVGNKASHRQISSKDKFGPNKKRHGKKSKQC